MHKSLIAVPLIVMSAGSLAADNVTINVSGTLHQPTICNVTATATTIPFGNILSSRINGSEYQKPLNVSLACTNRNPLNSVAIQVSGSGTSGNKLPVTGAAKGFVLALKRGGAALNFGSSVPISTDGSLNLTITPEIKSGEAFVSGAFSASLTVKVNVT